MLIETTMHTRESLRYLLCEGDGPCFEGLLDPLLPLLLLEDCGEWWNAAIKHCSMAIFWSMVPHKEDPEYEVYEEVLIRNLDMRESEDDELHPLLAYITLLEAVEVNEGKACVQPFVEVLDRYIPGDWRSVTCHYNQPGLRLTPSPGCAGG